MTHDDDDNPRRVYRNPSLWGGGRSPHAPRGPRRSFSATAAATAAFNIRRRRRRRRRRPTTARVYLQKKNQS